MERLVDVANTHTVGEHPGEQIVVFRVQALICKAILVTPQDLSSCEHGSVDNGGSEQGQKPGTVRSRAPHGGPSQHPPFLVNELIAGADYRNVGTTSQKLHLAFHPSGPGYVVSVHPRDECAASLSEAPIKSPNQSEVDFVRYDPDAPIALRVGSQNLSGPIARPIIKRDHLEIAVCLAQDRIESRWEESLSVKAW